MSQPVPPSRVRRATPRPRRRRGVRTVALGLVALVFAGALTAGGAVFTNAFGAGDRFASLLERIDLLIDPPPDRPTAPTIVSTPRPLAEANPTAEPSPTPTPVGSSEPGVSAPPVTPAPSPTPTPKREPVDVKVVSKPRNVFISQQTKDWCAPAGVQMTLAALGLADNSERFQRELDDRSGEWESRRDSLNGGWGPGAMVQALEAYGARGYEIRGFERRNDALVDAARAITETESPAILLAWRGAHTWVMTGYRADADPLRFDGVRVTGAYILDPWYPRVSSIWGASDGPGVYQDADEMQRNFRPWERPEGRYPDRDGLWLVVVPTIHADQQG
jgi:hypothetical protein